MKRHRSIAGRNKVSENNVRARSKNKPNNGVRPTRLYKPTARSRVTNGRGLLRGDQRTIWCRRFRDLMALHTADLGGDDDISHAERAILRRAACLITELERLEARFA